MKFITYKEYTPINLEHIIKIEKPNTSHFKINFKESNNTLQWNFDTEQERDNVYDKIIKNINPINL